MVAAFDLVLAFNDPHTILQSRSRSFTSLERSESMERELADDHMQATLHARGPSEIVEPPAGYPGPP